MLNVCVIAVLVLYQRRTSQLLYLYPNPPLSDSVLSSFLAEVVAAECKLEPKVNEISYVEY